MNFDVRHRAVEAKELEIGDRVIVKDLDREERVEKQIGERDYQLTNNIRRNRYNCNPLVDNDINSNVPSNETDSISPRNIPAQTPERNVNLEPMMRRSTRIIHKPARYNEER